MEILDSKDSTTFIVENGTPMMFTVGAGAVPKAKSTTPLSKENKNKEFAHWFTEDNNYPGKIIKAAKADPELYPMIDSYAKSLYSGGAIYGQFRMDNGKLVFDRLFDTEINAWLDNSNIQHYLQEAFIDCKTFSQAWAEISYDLLGNGKGHVAQLSIQDASFCRYGLQDPKTGFKTKTLVSTEWANNKTDWTEFHTIDPYYRPLQQIIESKKDVVYYPLVSPGIPGSSFYQIAPWHGLLEGDVLELSKLMIQFKKYYLQNGMSIKYHVEIHPQFFEKKYLDKWTEGTHKERIAIMQAEAAAFNEVVTGIENSGKVLLTMLDHLKNDPRMEPFSTWKITPIDLKTVSGEYTNDMNQNTLIKYRALDFDPAIKGGVSGDSGKIGGGSGSDARVAWQVHQIFNKPLQDLVYSPLNKVIKHINGWEKKYPGLTFMNENYFLATQDQVSPSNRM
jgi:hypothetical protein